MSSVKSKPKARTPRKVKDLSPRKGKDVKGGFNPQPDPPARSGKG